MHDINKIHILILLATILLIGHTPHIFPQGNNQNKTAEKKEEAPKKSPKDSSSNKPATTTENKTGTGTASESKKSALSEKEQKKQDDLKEKEKKRTEYIESTLDFGIHKDRLEALNRIRMIKMEEFTNRLKEKVVQLIGKEINTQVLKKAIYTAAELKITNAVDVIIPHIDSDDEDVVIASAFALMELEGIKAKDKLISRLKKQDFAKDSNLTGTIIETLGSFKTKELLKLAIDTIKDTKSTKLAKESFVLFLGKLDSVESKDILKKLYMDPEEDIVIRSYAVNSLAKLGVSESVEVIKGVLKEIDSYPFKKKQKYYNLSMYSVAALVKLGDNSGYERLLEALKSDSARVRLKAISLIKEIDDERTVDILKYKIKYDPNQSVRSEAEKALKEIEEKKEKARLEKEKNQKKGAMESKTGTPGKIIEVKPGP